MKSAPDQLRDLATRLLLSRGASPEPAALQADILIEAELRGLPSHGLQRLPLLLSRIEKGLVNPNTFGTGTLTRQAFWSVDGERGLGPVVVMNALRIMKNALPETGVAVAAIRNANHIGMLAYYTEAAARDGLIAIIMSTSEALVHPFRGTEAMLGTNPISVGIPTDEQPFVLDLATSVVPMGKIKNHALRGAKIPPGWAVDADGRPTEDPVAAQQGAIAPFGGAKGYGLGLAIELLVAALAGSALSPQVHGTLDDVHPVNKGELLILVDPAAGNGTLPALTAYLRSLRLSRPLDPSQPVAVPGDGARCRRAIAMKEGIALPQPLLEQLRALEAA
ncbi:dehydrogenase [Ochrobactrum sp. POC9]|uniref:Ldh family oxidoreductase n=1 Tax=Ochrobactrum sp. POC9 TaxID=2203419 RepID=UPI000D705B9E|nr:Ldh family oxidoreductase [Ochrobactrum sp. POC9]PWU70833.1 dehydrogenase [Ochrobactrum sp. POC9]